MRTTSRRLAASTVAGVATILTSPGVAHATSRCTGDTHPSQTAYYVLMTGSVLATVLVAGLGVKATLGERGWRRVIAALVTAVGTGTCAFLGFWVTLIGGMMLSGCVTN